MANDTDHDETPFGKRFADAWTLLCAYLADLDARELAEIAKTDFDGTLAVLKRQPALGQSGALDEAADLAPETLALAIIQERIRVLTGQLSSGPENTFGQRFLNHWREAGGLVSCFSYAQIQQLKKAEREEVVGMFKTRGSGFKIAQILRTSTPEAAAELIVTRLGINPLFVGQILI